MMSRKIVYNTNSTQDHQVLINDPDITQKNNFSYCRFSDIISGGDKRINSKPLISIAILILIFLLGFFTHYLMSPIESQKTLCYHEDLNNSSKYMLTRSNDTIMDSTTKNTENLTTFVSITTENNHLHNTSENIHNITTEGTVTPVSSTVLLRETTTVTPVSTTVTVTEERRHELEKCITDRTYQFEDISTSHLHGYCEEKPIGIKSIVEFIASDEELFDCLTEHKNCDTEFHGHLEKDVYVHDMKHIRYNFVMGDRGNVYEGRPLSCNFGDIRHVDWGSLGYNDSEIIIGIPSCHKLDGENFWKKSQFYHGVSNLLYCFERQGLLSDSFIMKLDKNCEHFLNQHFISFYGKRIEFIDRHIKEHGDESEPNVDIDDPYYNYE